MELIPPLVRFIHYIAALQLFGLSLFQAAIVPDAAKRNLSAAATRLAVPCALLLVLSALAWWIATAATMSGSWIDAVDPAVLLLVLTETEFGRVWAWHSAIVTLVAAVVWLRPLRSWRAAAVLSGLVLATIGLTGHATIGTGAAWYLNRASHVLHLLAAGFWLGSLVPLLFCISALSSAKLGPDAMTAIERFSGLGHLAVALIVATGALNTWLLAGGEAPLAAPYQQVLIVKVVIVGAMIGLAGANRYVFLPAVEVGHSGTGRLRVGVLLEVVLGASIIGLVSVLGAMSPA